MAKNISKLVAAGVAIGVAAGMTKDVAAGVGKMLDRSSVIFGNAMDAAVLRKAEKSKQKFIKKYGDDSQKKYHLGLEPINQISEIKLQNLVHSEEPLVLPENPLIVGNIRMGFGHYRISLAIASCAQAMGFTPVWFDLASFDATGSSMIRSQNDLYSLGSKISQKSRLFNYFVWEPMNSEGFKRITYNATDQKNAELLVPLYGDLPKNVPFAATHVWPSQGAVHAGLTNVVNAIPDNWPMGLHLSEGSIHAVQTPFAYLGYKSLNGMAKHPLKHIPDNDLFEVGHYVDHEIVSNVEQDCERRIWRQNAKAPVRFLLTVGGAGAGGDLYVDMTKHLLEHVKAGRASVIINFGDHLSMWDVFKKKIPGIEKITKTYFDDYAGLRDFADAYVNGDANWNANATENADANANANTKIQGACSDSAIIAVCNKDIFEAVYSTNLLMRGCDILVTKPSELVFYPVPKLFMRHIGGHEVYGAMHAQEIGDATNECKTSKEICDMIDILVEDRKIITHMCERIVSLKEYGIYNGGYEVVKLAAKI